MCDSCVPLNTHLIFTNLPAVRVPCTPKTGAKACHTTCLCVLCRPSCPAHAAAFCLNCGSCKSWLAMVTAYCLPLLVRQHRVRLLLRNSSTHSYITFPTGMKSSFKPIIPTNYSNWERFTGVCSFRGKTRQFPELATPTWNTCIPIWCCQEYARIPASRNTRFSDTRVSRSPARHAHGGNTRKAGLSYACRAGQRGHTRPAFGTW